VPLLPGGHSCTVVVTSLDKDHDAVLAGLTLPCSNGPIEGGNTKTKLLKRQTYGRASFALLRKRILLVD
jgi:transposase